MSFIKRSISDYVKDIPMRFSNTFSQIPPESYLRSFDLSPIFVERLNATDFDYDFNVERSALQDAQRERERVMKEAEQKLKELELSNQLNETLVKKPIEDVINSSTPIQLVNQQTSLTDYKSGQSNYPYGATNYVTQPAYNSFNNYTSTIQDSGHNSLISTQSCLPQQTIRPKEISNNVHSQNPLNQTTPTSLTTNNYLTPANLTSGNSLVSDMTRNRSINMTPNDQQTKPQHQSDNNVPPSNQQNDLKLTNMGRPNLNAIYNTQLHSQSQQVHTQTNLSTFQTGYNAYPPVTLSYPMGHSMNVYNLPQAYQPLNNHLINSRHQTTTSSIDSVQNGQPIKSNSPSNYNPIPNYVASSYPLNGSLLMPQQSSSANNSKEQSLNVKKTQVTKNGKDVGDVGLMPNCSSTSNSISNYPSSTNPFNSSNSGKINVADFENSSSPFDDALLRSIDDKQELNNIFQQFYQNGAHK